MAISKKPSQADKSQSEYFLIGRQLAQAIIDYLGTRPHNEVRALIDGLAQIPTVNINNDTPKERQVAAAVKARKKPTPRRR